MRMWLNRVVLVCLVLSKMCGTAKNSVPVVFSYAEKSKLIHPALISHHYHYPPTIPRIIKSPLHTNEEFNSNRQHVIPPNLNGDTRHSFPPLQFHDDKHHNYLSSTTGTSRELTTERGNFITRPYSRYPSQTTPGLYNVTATPIKDSGRSPHTPPSLSMSSHHVDYHDNVDPTYQSPSFSKDKFISTTPIFESEPPTDTKKLPSIVDYSPPNFEYITFKDSANHSSETVQNDQSNMNISEQIWLASPKTNRRLRKVLQKPTNFAYSSDLKAEGMETVNSQVHGQAGKASHEENRAHSHENTKENDQNHVKGGDQSHSSDHKASAGHENDKNFKEYHKFTKAQKGHHDKEGHKGKYSDEKGKKGEKKEEGGHYGEHHKAEKGKKAAKYDETGEHKKGHSTKGEHNIHKKDEYLKKYEFFDEYHEGGDHEKHGHFKESRAHKKGKKKKKGHHKSGHHSNHKGKKGHHQKGIKSDYHKGHKDAKGHDGKYKNHHKYGKKGMSKKGKYWKFHSGDHK